MFLIVDSIDTYVVEQFHYQLLQVNQCQLVFDFEICSEIDSLTKTNLNTFKDYAIYKIYKQIK